MSVPKKVARVFEPLKGSVTIPADKSISHRAVMLASLAKGKSVIKNFSSGADCQSTLNVFKALGIEAKFTDAKTLKIISSGKLIPNTDNIYPCGNSGTTMRLTAGILAGQKFDSVLTGDESLSKRPMGRIIKPLSLMGGLIDSVDGHAPLTIRGKSLAGIDYISPLSSAQVKSCVLLAGINASGVTTFEEPVLSRDHTERMLKYMGADIKAEGRRVSVKKSGLIPKEIEIPGDISSAAFFIVAGLIVKGSDFVIKNVGINPARTGIIDIVKRMGGNVEILDSRILSGEERADLRVRYTENLKSCTISGADIPKLIDELPVIAVLASQAVGETFVSDAADLRNKESDRIFCLVKELRKVGVDIDETPDGFIVRGKNILRGGVELETYHDHRLAMSFYVAGLICKEEILINGFEWTNISFPEFEKLFAELSL